MRLAKQVALFSLAAVLAAAAGLGYRFVHDYQDKATELGFSGALERWSANRTGIDDAKEWARKVAADKRADREAEERRKKLEQPDPFEAADAAIKRDDEDGALKILLPLAEQGNAEAQYRVGATYYLLKQNNVDALKWFQQGADKGPAGAMYYLGNIYNNGNGVRQNYIEAHKWYILAASQAGPRQKGEMATLQMAIENRDALARKMTAAQIATSQKMARDWSKEHKIAAPDPKRSVAKEPDAQQTCSTSGQFKTCTVAEPWGTRTMVTNLRATQQVRTEFGEKLQNIHSVRFIFNDVQSDTTAPLTMIGGFMMLVLPSSTQDQRAALLNQVSSVANKSSVQTYGWNWNINSSGPTPGKSITFEATATR